MHDGDTMLFHTKYEKVASCSVTPCKAQENHPIPTLQTNKALTFPMDIDKHSLAMHQCSGR